LEKVQSQPVKVQAQPAERQGGGLAFVSPQGEQIAQLEALIDASPGQAGLRELDANIQNSPRQAAQRKAGITIQLKPRLTASNQQLDSGALIRDALGSFTVLQAHEFPNQTSGDGCVGSLCVSKYVTRAVAGTTEKIALHVTFNITGIFVPSTNGWGGATNIRINASNLHFTARPVATQVTISENGGGSILTAQSSIHRGIANDWTFDDGKRTALAAALNLPTAGIEAVVRTALAGDDGAALTGIRDGLNSKLSQKMLGRMELDVDYGRVETVWA
jgi:hypothetical protein